jgi:hypothetical protein
MSTPNRYQQAHARRTEKRATHVNSVWFEKMKPIINALGFAVLAVLGFPWVLSACTGIMGTPATWLLDSEAIVRVRALEELGSRRQGSPQQFRDLAVATGRELDTKIRFQVLEVLKGNAVGGHLEFEGMFTDQDDRNDGPAPYTFVRNQGRGGNCFAYTYRQGQEYLLILGAGNGGLTPYWQTLAATNEQLSDANDRWLAWVRAQLQNRKP